MNLRCLGLVLGVGVSASACVSTPETIPAAYVSDVPYRPLSCGELLAELGNIDNAYGPLYTQQAQARSADVIMPILPTSRLLGQDVSAQIGQLKGQREAVERVLKDKGCDIPGPKPLPALPPVG